MALRPILLAALALSTAASAQAAPQLQLSPLFGMPLTCAVKPYPPSQGVADVIIGNPGVNSLAAGTRVVITPAHGSAVTVSLPQALPAYQNELLRRVAITTVSCKAHTVGVMQQPLRAN